MIRRALATLVLALAGCTAPECAPERLPYGGRAQTTEELFHLVQHASRYDCCDALHASLSRATREEHGKVGFCAFWASSDLPEPYEEYELGEVVREGKLDYVFPGDQEGEEWLFVTYDRDGETGPLPTLFAKILVRFESESGPLQPKLALQEQFEAIDGGDVRYFWDTTR